MHFRRGSEVRLIGLIPELRVIGGACAARVGDQKHDVVGERVLMLDVVDVVRADKLEAELPGEPRRFLADHLLAVDAVVLDFNVEIPAENLLVYPRCFVRFFVPPRSQMCRDDTSGTRRKRDEPLTVLPEDVRVKPRLVVEPLKVGDCGELEEVSVSGQVLCKEDDVMITRTLSSGFRFLARLLETAPFRHDIRFHADDRLDPGFRGFLVEFDGPEKHAVIRERHGGHAVLDGGMNQILDATGRIEEAVVGMIVKMDELWHRCSDVTRHSREAAGKNQEREGTTFEHLVQREGRTALCALMPRLNGRTQSSRTSWITAPSFMKD